MCDFVFQVAAAAARVPVVIFSAALGAGVAVGQGLLRFVWNLLPSLGADATVGHHAGRVRERAMEAAKAARASGLLQGDR